MTQLTHKQQQLFNALSIVVGNAMYALTVVLFLMPSGLITGGATGIALAFNKVTGLPVSGVLFVINVAMLLLGWWVLGRRFALNTMASTVLSPFFMALWEHLLGNLVLTDDLVLNTVFAGFGIGISLGITISAKSDEICAAIFAQLDRGVTILHGEGGYLREPESVLLSVVSNRQLPRLEKLAHTIDPTCFMIVSHVTEVSGRGFSLEKDYQVEE